MRPGDRDATDRDGIDHEDIDGFDDLPATHLDDDEYDEFLSKEFDRDGALRDGPPVGFWIGVLIAVMAAIAIAVAL